MQVAAGASIASAVLGKYELLECLDRQSLRCHGCWRLSLSDQPGTPEWEEPPCLEHC